MRQQSPSLASVTSWFGTKASYLLFMYFIHADVLTCVHCMNHPYSCHALLQWPFNNANIPPTKKRHRQRALGPQHLQTIAATGTMATFLVVKSAMLESGGDKNNLKHTDMMQTGLALAKEILPTLLAIKAPLGEMLDEMVSMLEALLPPYTGKPFAPLGTRGFSEF